MQQVYVQIQTFENCWVLAEITMGVSNDIAAHSVDANMLT